MIRISNPQNPLEEKTVPLVETPTGPIDGSEKHAALVRRYRNFASGGAEIEDARLAVMRKQLTLEEEHKRLDEEAFRCLFGTPSNCPPRTETTTVGRVSHVQGESRRRYVQYYSNQGRPGANGKISEEPSLIDSLI